MVTKLHPRSAASARVLVLCLASGVAADLTLAAGIPGVGMTVFALFLTTVLLVRTRSASTQARCCLAAAAVLSLGFAAFSSGWVAALCGGGVIASLLIGASLSRGGDLFDLSWPDVALRAAAGAGHSLLTVPWLGWSFAALARTAGGEGRRPFFRGLLVATPLVVGLGMLLASADPLFASLFGLNVDASSVFFHASLIIGGAVIVAALVRIAEAGEMPALAALSPQRLRMTESLVVFAGLTALFAAFAATQIAAVLGAGRDLLVRDGITYSEYARSGYFQLIAVVLITLVALPFFRPVALHRGGRSRAIRGLCAAVVMLTLAIGAVALRRLWLYNDAYGLTMLRLTSAAAAAWFGVLLLLLGASLMRVAPRRSWFPGASLITLLLFIGAFAILNPEAYVARYNVAHTHHIQFDTAYLATLSDDAVPDLVTATATLDAASGAALRNALCHRSPASGMWSTWTASGASAADALRKLCT